jgi:hypothetical protein
MEPYIPNDVLPNITNNLILDDLRSIRETNQYFNKMYISNYRLNNLIIKIDKIIYIVDHRKQIFI